ncbi:hypothetical protein NDU88_006706 [Pleurodeles waltl]|uniref:Uncharacterized protein n=1 Tax=Pleurodeles waltl TaxID=8319 RepID=A0AAV7TZA5_PLEWA|nr:hypothetical protein NDU88_006706 [Pleurodeles waltl]
MPRFTRCHPLVAPAPDQQATSRRSCGGPLFTKRRDPAGSLSIGTRAVPKVPSSKGGSTGSKADADSAVGKGCPAKPKLTNRNIQARPSKGLV